ncbi:hypothetical protein TREMEDRAFT_74139 [Tremella mesenterica DSM 1558]|uniref:uncharacterized protein n=1 Tax=Tremella mesenterica (strain ATCC 24925 / CBS 8224 / DSM 1558 / NBRC 9311 / NRRL Y-6157 / RJB 2259-6 / UBC 559-6) TaxID=578456 RepID=UPI0003F49566|nr:uncharacterized protein TREMEDRAFT_74139 [Tremella mesenterica DSM 1558]EIW68690.1 hypothetical protein TREMEDRAFT_74139 [Tremella mesenterica DSM 1558]
MSVQPLFTCISCKVAFESPIEQRNHFNADWHRYNMKRRVANLPPVAADAFNDKVIQYREQNAVRADPRSLICVPCGKSFSNENSFRTHVLSRKHRDRETGAQAGHNSARIAPKPLENATAPDVQDHGSNDGNVSDDDDLQGKLATARRGIRPSDCLFCPKRFQTVTSALSHMSHFHSFFIPRQEDLVDLPGLLSYLGEKIVIGNLCLYCPNGGREFGTIQAVRAHMIDKGHCKMAFESPEDKIEVAEYYGHDQVSDHEESEWEDVPSADDGSTSSTHISTHAVTIRHDGLSLTLPSGRTIGHRSLKRYFAQRFGPAYGTSHALDPTQEKIANIRARLADPSLALVPLAGGVGVAKKGLSVVAARNPGEARWAKRQGGSFLDQKRHLENKYKIGMIHNSQKHFRDALLQ